MAIKAASVMAEVGVDTSKAERGLKQFGDKLNQTGKSGAQSMLPVRSALGGLEGAAKIATGGITGLGAAMGAVAITAVAARLGGAVVEMAKLSDQSARLAGSFDDLAAKAGTSSSEIMTRLKQASGGAIAEYDLMLAANKAMLLGVADSSEEMGQLMEIARVRGTAMGLSTAQAFNDLVTGLGRGSALILDNLGIMVDADATNKAYAASIGKTVAQLTEQEKKQALVNATLKEATGQALPMASSYERMGAAMADMRVELGALFSPAIAAAADMIASGIGAINDRAAEGVAANNLAAFNAAQANTMQAWGSYLEKYNEELAKWEKATETFAAFNPGTDVGEFSPNLDIMGQLGGIQEQWRILEQQANAYNEAAAKIGSPALDIELMKRGQMETVETTKATDGLAAANENATGSISETSQALIDQANKLNIVGGALNDYMSGLDGLMSDMARQEGVVAALSMLDSAEAKVRATVAAYEAMGWSQERIALEVRLLGEDAAASWQQMIDGAERAASATEAAHGAQMAAGESARGLGIELNFVRDAGFGAKGGIDAAGFSAVSAQGSFWGLADAAMQASEAMRQAQVDAAANRIQGAFLGAVGTLGADTTHDQYQRAIAGLELFERGLKAAGVSTERQQFLLEEYNVRVADAIQKQVDAVNVQRDNISAHEMAGRRAAGLGVAASGATGKLGGLSDKVGDLSGRFQGLLDKIPGLKGTSDVSEKQMADAKLGIPQNFADDYLRRLTDEVLNGVDWAGIDIGDAAARAGIDPNLPAEVILEMFKNAWADSSLFANPANLDLINMDAVKASIQQQQAAGTGAANINALFGIGDDATVAAVAGLGLDIQSGLAQWLSENGMSDAGAKLASALGAGVTEGGIPVDGGLNSWLSSDAGGSAVNAFGKVLGDRLSERTFVTPQLLPPAVPAAPTGGNSDLPPTGQTPRSGLFGGAGRGAAAVVVNATVQQPHDIPMLARAVAREMQRH